MNIKEVKVNDTKSTNTKIFIFVENESEFDRVLESQNRPYKVYKTEVIPKVKDILKERGIDIEGMKISWNQYAGCSCGCSPGFILKGSTSQGAKEIYVTIE